MLIGEKYQSVVVVIKQTKSRVCTVYWASLSQEIINLITFVIFKSERSEDVSVIFSKIVKKIFLLIGIFVHNCICSDTS